MSDALPSLKQLRYLVALADTGHFRHAAEQCGITQPSLSLQLQNLESMLGSRLLERGRGGALLTPAGREIVDRARRVLLDVQGIVDVASAASQRLVGTIRLGVKPTLGPYLLPSVVGALHRNNPDLKLYVREGAPYALEGELLHGTHDLILAQLPIASSDLTVERLFREPIYLALAADHPLAEKKEIDAAALDGLAVLSLSPDYHLHDQVQGLCEEFGATLVRDYEGTSLDALRQMVAMNMGAAFLPALYVESETRDDDGIVIRELKGRKISRSIGLVWRRSAGRAPAFSEIAETIRHVVRSRFSGLTLED